ncbi:ZP domain-containing protein isoform X2 [Pocillopora verrucosa]
MSTSSIVCNANHTVTITITNVTDIDAFNESDWRVDNKTECEPTFMDTTVTYTNLQVADCASISEDKSTSIRYVFEIRAVVPGSSPIQAFDHVIDAVCEYVNNGNVTSSFIPLVNRGDNSSDSAAFTFSLDVFKNSELTIPLPSEVKLNQPLFFRAQVETSSAAPNLDLFILQCNASKSNDANVPGHDVVLIQNGCGNDTVSQDAGDTLNYTCAVDSTQETFQVNSFRYFGAEANTLVYVHCDLKVCLADAADSACECPSLADCNPNARKRRAVEVDESVVYRVTVGPYYYKKVERDDKDHNDKKPETSEDNSSFQLSLSVAIVFSVSGVIIVSIISLTVCFISRGRHQRSSITELNK